MGEAYEIIFVGLILIIIAVVSMHNIKMNVQNNLEAACYEYNWPLDEGVDCERKASELAKKLTSP